MSSAENDVRLVPMTREQRDALDRAIRDLEDYGGLLGNTSAQAVQVLRAAFDAAPADPAEAVRDALPWGDDEPHIDAIVRDVLAALGAPTTPGE